MPGFLLHVGAIVQCMHGGIAQPTVPNPRVKVMGQPIVMQPGPYVVAGCPLVYGVVPSPCVTAQWLLASLRVKANGLPVLLQDSQAVCVPNGTGLIISLTQVRVKGM
ncbi:MAG TPA: hypothetical protein VF897_16630 [Roseiflexaceae bacterium]